ncbi:stage III sporulation protein AF [Pelagirhabdus alkalitolerans]|nr:stage III sporulation protein AF [Pelagirhabdus alkalitolerans]
MSEMIILLIMISMIQMMLPNRHIKKYIHLSLSLLFLIYFLQPLDRLTDLTVQHEAEQIVEDLLNEDGLRDMSIQSNSQKNEIEAYIDAYILNDLTNKLKSDLNDELANMFGYKIDQVKWDQIDIDNELHDRLHVYLQESSRQVVIEPVSLEDQRTRYKQEPDLNEKVHQWLKNRLELGRDQLIVYLEGGKQ